tara:strand:- start:1668 stop:2048 length:381 start_codon:yes stop_codon:yes gene_type:complete
MDNFDAHKWFKKEYLGEGHTEDKTERDQFIRRYDQLSDDDKLKLAKIQAMMDKERSLREDNLEEKARVNMNPDEVFDRMEDLADQRKLNELKDLIYDLGEEWVAEGFDSLDIGEYLEDLVYKLVRS